MTSQPFQPPQASWPSAQTALLGRYALLVPEAPALLVLLFLHMFAGHPLITAFIGLALVIYFATRTALLAWVRYQISVARYSAAEQALAIALRLHPYSADAYTLLGMLNLARGHTEPAIAALRRANSYFPLHGHLHTLLSGALLEDGDAAGAFVTARQAVQLEPQNANAYLHLASAEQAIGSAPDIAERHLRTGLERCVDPLDEAALRCALAALLLHHNRLGEAQLALAGVPSLLDKCPPAQRAGLHFHLGELYHQIGEQETARGHFNASEHLDPHGRYAAAAWRAARS